MVVDAVDGAVSARLVTAGAGGVAVVAGADTWGCAGGFLLNPYTARCCLAEGASPGPPPDLSRAIWSPDGCR